jgi:hypothetical protein
MPLELDHIEVQVVECRAHAVKAVLRFDDELVIAVGVSPLFLLFGERAVVAQAAPFFAGAADPTVKDFPVRKFDHVAQFVDQFRKLDVGFSALEFVTDLVGDGDQNTIVVFGRCHRQQDQVLAILQTLDNFLGGLLPLEFRKTFLDVLDFKRSGLERVLTDDVFHSAKYSSRLRLEPFIKDANDARRQSEMDCGAQVCDDPELHLIAAARNLFDIADVPIHRFPERQAGPAG